MINLIKVIKSYFQGGWRWFIIGRCELCDHIHLIFKEDRICEDCWLNTK